LLFIGIRTDGTIIIASTDSVPNIPKTIFSHRGQLELLTSSYSLEAEEIDEIEEISEGSLFIALQITIWQSAR